MLSIVASIGKFANNEITSKDIQKQSQAWSFIKKETLTRVFPGEFCETSKNTFFTERLLVTASGH